MAKVTAIDTHAHLWSNAYLDQLHENGSEETEIAKGMGAGTSPEEMDKRLKMMEKAGVAQQVLSATPQSPYFGGEDKALKAAQMINDTYAKVIKNYPGKFMAYGAVPLPYIDAAIEEAKRAINDLGFLGIAVNTYINGEYAFDEKFFPFWEALDEMDTIVYIHPTGKGACSPMVNDWDLEWVVGAPIEDLLAVLHILKSDLPARLPHLKFHIAHLGGGLGFQMQRVEDNYEDWDSFKHSPKETLKDRFYFDSANFLEEALKLSVDVFGEDKILMGSDFPYFQNDKYTRAAEYIRNAKLDDGVKAKILRANAESLYHIKPND